MHAFVLLIVAAMPLPAYSSEHQQKMHDRIVFEGAERVVFRTSEWPNFEGNAIPVEQKLTVNPDGDLRYDYHAQSPETQAYHRALCAEQGLDAATEGESIFSTDSAGWNCIHVIEYLPGTAPPQLRLLPRPPSHHTPQSISMPQRPAEPLPLAPTSHPRVMPMCKAPFPVPFAQRCQWTTAAAPAWKAVSPSCAATPQAQCRSSPAIEYAAQETGTRDERVGYPVTVPTTPASLASI